MRTKKQWPTGVQVTQWEYHARELHFHGYDYELNLLYCWVEGREPLYRKFGIK